MHALAGPNTPNLVRGDPEACILRSQRQSTRGVARYPSMRKPQNTCLQNITTYAELAPVPLSIDPSPHTFDCLRRRSSRPPRARGADGCCCCNAAAGAATLELTAAPVAPHRAPWAARRTARCCSALWANRLHIGGSHHIVMSPSEALARLLKNHDHCFNWMVMLLCGAACGDCGQMVT